MYGPSANHRRLFMHAAHRTIGVLGFGRAIGDRRPVEDFSSDDDPPRQAPEDDGGEPKPGPQDEDHA
jgi:hypothetical protein